MNRASEWALSILKQYDPYGRLSTQELQRGAHGQSELLAHYHYDTLGRIAGIDSAQGSSSFSYDVRGRLAQFKQGAYRQDYHYDGAGNMLDPAQGLIGFSEQGFSGQGLSEQTNPNSVIYTHKVGKDNPPPLIKFFLNGHSLVTK